MGKLIVFEGTDGSGKSTQFSLLTRRLEARGVDFRTMVFPQYTEPSSALIRMYLGGEFGARPSDVNAYTASTFYAVDRFAAFRKVWGEYYRNGGLMLSDRYTTSNAVHQASKEPEQDREKFFAWLYDLAYPWPWGSPVFPSRPAPGPRCRTRRGSFLFPSGRSSGI